METIKVDKKDIATVIGKGGATIRKSLKHLELKLMLKTLAR